ncbi:hypothetical protein [Flavobacterium sp. CSZ]|uniref:hypothetical protein n=1 Tax=Flavobacterium sp. CSZ TaxID=2783791 RepID=UPI001889F9C6|nr:hypothetical protein [Flavobacterium sp. CSZ]MBF4487735.1 hypothetical protein [Flavobacterium sp. CSZ]
MAFKLTTEIIELSTAGIWQQAKLEWDFHLAYYSNEKLTCLCGHFPIRNICVIRNRTNKVETEVGNCCIKKFLGIADGDKIFNSIKKLKEDISKSINAETLEYLRERGAVNDYEYDFYKDIWRKRNLSNKQNNLKIKINEKFLKFTSYQTNSQFLKINRILSWSNGHTDFDTQFVLSMKRSCEKNGGLTEKQVLALDNIIEKFGIHDNV